MILTILSFFAFLLLAVGILRNGKVANLSENTFSIIIACRNEEKNLPFLFTALRKIDYPPEKYEIILVDDASSDNSLSLIKKFCETSENAYFIHLPIKDEEFKGKKAALQKAAEKAEYDFLLFTDADCIVPENWLKTYNNYIDSEVGMVVGYYKNADDSVFRIFLQLMTAAIFAASVGLGFPFSAAGGNLLVRKKTFFEIGGYEKIKNRVAGDDKQLLGLISKTKWKIRYNPQAKVVTIPVKHPHTFFQQQKRKYGKIGMSSPIFQFLTLLVFLFYLYLPYQLIVKKDFKSFLIYFAGFLLFWIVNLAKHKEKFKFIHLFYLIIFPYYLIFFSVLGHFSAWKWKGNENL